MDLNTFISVTMVRITEDVEIAMEEIPNSSRTAIVAPKKKSEERSGRQNIEFKVALTFQKASSADGKLSLKVFGAGIGGGGSMATENSTVSRVEFSVPLWMPYREVNEE